MTPSAAWKRSRSPVAALKSINFMRILHLINHCNFGNGSVHVAVDLACAQAERGHAVAVAADGGDYLDLLMDHGVRYEPLAQRQTNPIRLMVSVAGVIRICHSFKPDVVHAHMMAAAVFGKMASILFRIPLVTTVHNSFDRHSVLMRLGDRVVAVSNAERALLVDRGYNPKKIHVVLNGPNGSPRARHVEEIDSGALDRIRSPFMITVCGLHRRKGVHDVIAAFATIACKFPAWKLYVAGDGPDKKALVELANNLEVGDRVIFLGYVRNPLEILNKAEIFVLASHAEPFGLATAEAREAGCAIVATSVGGTPEVLDFGRAGMLVKTSSPAAIAAALAELMSDPLLLQAFKARSKRGSQYYRVGRVAQEYIQVYQSLLPHLS
jgi:glycosyltransferase involved in cell wall biosynthesis